MSEDSPENLFASDSPPGQAAALSASAPPPPLAERLRPTHLGDVVGQAHLLDSDGALARMVAAKKLSSLIFWGPPGSGKTTIARLLAEAVELRFVALSAVFSSVADLKKYFVQADSLRQSGQQTLLFVDEIHRFNRAQQDSFLPYIERGTCILLGATTENPSFALNSALLSRVQVLTLNRLDEQALEVLLQRAEADSERDLPVTAEARAALIASADGDGRFLLNQAEMIFDSTESSPVSSPQAASESALESAPEAAPAPTLMNPSELRAFLDRRMPLYDKDRDGHYNLISALHKTMRGSDPQAALYWLARMLVAGEEPLYILRRITRFASEDIGLADPNALQQCIAAKQTYEFLGSPEGELAIVQACLYCATAPKSNATYRAQKAAWALARESGSLTPPAHILNAPTKLMKDLGYGKGYVYDHDNADGFSGQNYWPEGLDAQQFYTPSNRGFEKKIAARLAWWDSKRTPNSP